MKIRETLSNISSGGIWRKYGKDDSPVKIKTAFIAFAVSIAVLIPLAWLNMADNAPGWSSTLFSVVSSLALIIIAVSVFISDDVKKTVASHKCKWLSVFFVLSALAVLADGLISLYSYLEFKDIELGPIITNDYISSLGSYLSQNNGIEFSTQIIYKLLIFKGNTALLYFLVSVLAAVGFAFMANDSFRGKNVLRRLPVISLLPTVWGCVRIVLVFMHYTTIADLSNNYIDILFYSLVLIFLFLQSKLFSNFELRNSTKSVILSGFCAVLVGFLTFGMRQLVILLGSGENLTVSQQPDFMNLIISVMILAYIVFFVFSAKEMEITEETQEEQAESDEVAEDTIEDEKELEDKSTDE